MISGMSSRSRDHGRPLRPFEARLSLVLAPYARANATISRAPASVSSRSENSGQARSQRLECLIGPRLVSTARSQGTPSRSPPAVDRRPPDATRRRASINAIASSYREAHVCGARRPFMKVRRLRLIRGHLDRLPVERDRLIQAPSADRPLGGALEREASLPGERARLGAFGRVLVRGHVVTSQGTRQLVRTRPLEEPGGGQVARPSGPSERACCRRPRG